MEKYTGKSTKDTNDVGRPIIVYDDNSGEANNERPSISSGILFNLLILRTNILGNSL